MKKITIKDLRDAGITGGVAVAKRAVSNKGTETKANSVETYNELTGESETHANPALSVAADPLIAEELAKPIILRK